MFMFVSSRDAFALSWLVQKATGGRAASEPPASESVESAQDHSLQLHDVTSPPNVSRRSHRTTRALARAPAERAACSKWPWQVLADIALLKRCQALRPCRFQGRPTSTLHFKQYSGNATGFVTQPWEYLNGPSSTSTAQSFPQSVPPICTFYIRRVWAMLVSTCKYCTQ